MVLEINPDFSAVIPECSLPKLSYRRLLSKHRKNNQTMANKVGLQGHLSEADMGTCQRSI